jgi:hypothetical protein
LFGGRAEGPLRVRAAHLEEDWPIIESQKPREAPLDAGRPVHTRADHFSLVYRKTYVEFMARAQSGP